MEFKTYMLNISAENDEGKLENFYYQKFHDRHEIKKLREVIRIVNEFPEESFRLNNPQLTIDVLNEWTTIAKKASDLTGNSINWELLKIINGWIKENL